MIKKPVLIVLMTTLAILFTSCSGVPAPADTVKPPQGTRSDTANPPQDNPRNDLMNKYRELMGKNGSPAEIIKFAEENIGNLEKEDADIVIKGLIGAQKLKFENYEAKLLTPDFNDEINRHRLEELRDPDNLKDEGTGPLKSYLRDAFNDGFKLFEVEGMKDLEIDYESMYKSFSGYLSEDLAAYIGILAAQSAQHYLADGAITITYDELTDRIIKTEDFLKRFPSSEYKKEMEDLHNQYISTYLLGMNNTPAFDMGTLEIKRDLLKSFETAMTKYPDSALADVLTEYTQLLAKNDNKRSKEILQYVGKITGHPEYGTAE